MFIRNALIKMTANRPAQDLLEEIIQIAHILQGLGGGSGEVETSGEVYVLDLLKNKMSPPYCIFDVGANKGQYLKLIIDSIPSEDYSIHCFEPGHEVFKLLMNSVDARSNVFLNNVGFGKEICSATLHYDSVGSGAASLTKRRAEHMGFTFDKSEPVEITTIDSYCAEHGVERIHLLKIDVEGHELDVLNGARSMFENGLIDIVSFEFGACNVDTRTFFRDFWFFFTEMGMKIFRITPRGFFYPIESYSEIHEKHGGMNMLATSLPKTKEQTDRQ